MSAVLSNHALRAPPKVWAASQAPVYNDKIVRQFSVMAIVWGVGASVAIIAGAIFAYRQFGIYPENLDLLTSVNFNNLISYHGEHATLATACVREYRVQIPYGVVEMAGGRVSAIIEKPVKSFFVNAGIYVVDPSLLDRIIPGKYLDMTQLLEDVIGEGGAVGSFPIHEYWLDIGQFDDLERAHAEFQGVFGS